MVVGLPHYLTVAAILFTLGIFGIFINRKNVIVILMSVELILLSELAHRTNMKPAYDAIVKKHRGMASRLGFRMAHADWVSERRIDPVGEVLEG